MKHSEINSKSDCCEELVSKDNMFYFRGKYMAGLVCKKCNALYDNPDNSFLEYVSKYNKEG